MNIGLPTTGLGGIFYIVSAIMIIPIEILLTLKGKSSKNRWKFVIRQNLLALSVVATIYAIGYVLKKLLNVTNASKDSSMIVSGYGSLNINFMITAVIIFVVIEACIYSFHKLREKN